ncbi:MAG: tyrosine--tRNA ligase [Clostridia bacterium]|nr:tyrosine--tRNA ligase [Clostridia bacterium]
MMNVLDTLKQRGFLKQTVFGEELYELLSKEKVSFYVGFDPTADSLHIGHYIPIMAMAHMQRAGHKPICLFGGGTAMIGDPTGRTDLRQMLTKEQINSNIERFKVQMSRFIDFNGEDGAIMVNNADWLLNLNYVDFLRDIGVCFSVNKMLTAECFKTRLERGLNFLEFNYMLMQGYDFYRLFEDHNCVLQMGGDDQWSNMLAGVDLVRRKAQKPAYAATCTLLLTSDGKKMGKTAKGALWLDENKTTPYEFYQYFRNVEDSKVAECMKLLTFMELDEIEELTKYQDERMNAAKARLAFEVTKLVHGEEKALEAQKQAQGAFGGNADDMPTVTIPRSDFIPDIMLAAGIVKSKGEARTLISGGGVSINEEKVTGLTLDSTVLDKGEFILHKGKKVHVKVIFEQ